MSTTYNVFYDSNKEIIWASTADQNFDFSANQIIGPRFTGQSCTNLKFMVLKIPLAYGYMNNTYFG